MKNLLLLCFLVMFICGCEKEKDTGALTVSGYLTNGTGPVVKAKVNLDDLVQYSTTSNSEGFFEISNVPEGEYQLNFSVGSESESFSKNSEKIRLSSDLLLERLLLPDPVTIGEPEIERDFESNEVTLSWSTYTGDDFREYKLYKHSTSGLDETTGELLHVATLAQDTTYTLTLPHSSETFFRVFVKDNLGLLGGSNILDYVIGPVDYNPEIQLDIQNELYLNDGEEQELYFEAPEAGFYLIAWFDAGFSPYTTSHISMSAQNSDKSSYYFENQHLIIHNGAPIPIYVPAAERVYLKAKQVSESSFGSYGITITPLPFENSVPLEIGTELKQEIGLGEVRVLHFQAEANKQYRIRVKNNLDNYSYSPTSAKFMSVYEEGAISFSSYNVHVNPCCNDIPKLITVSVDNAYWLEETAADVLVTEL